LHWKSRFFDARARLESETDAEALHDLRIAVGRIHSLLIPVRALEGKDGLRSVAAEVGRLTSARELEVMAGELESRGYPRTAASRLARLKKEHLAILQHPALVNR